jgi:hypothetical protein
MRQKDFSEGNTIARLRSARLLISLSTSFDFEVPLVAILRAAWRCARARENPALLQRRRLAISAAGFNLNTDDDATALRNSAFESTKSDEAWWTSLAGVRAIDVMRRQQHV